MKFGPYELLERIGTGGMAEVFRATSRAGGSEKTLAIKRMLPLLSDDPKFVEMFVDEARLTGGLIHGNIAQVYDFGVADGCYYLAMQLVEGLDLRRVLMELEKRGERVPVAVAVHVMLQVAQALAYAHAKADAQGRPLGIVHRDVSPQNILISYDGEVKLVDFGIAKVRMRASETTQGRIKGKCAYMAPEQVRSLHVDGRTDVWGAGVVLHEVLSARPLFLAASQASTLQRVMHARVPPPSMANPEVSEPLDAVVARCLAREPRQRYRDGVELAATLGQLVVDHQMVLNAHDVAQWMRSNFGELAPGGGPTTPGSGAGQSNAKRLRERVDTARAKGRRGAVRGGAAQARARDGSEPGASAAMAVPPPVPADSEVDEEPTTGITHVERVVAGRMHGLLQSREVAAPAPEPMLDADEHSEHSPLSRLAQVADVADAAREHERALAAEARGAPVPQAAAAHPTGPYRPPAEALSPPAGHELEGAPPTRAKDLSDLAALSVAMRDGDGDAPAREAATRVARNVEDEPPTRGYAQVQRGGAAGAVQAAASAPRPDLDDDVRATVEVGQMSVTPPTDAELDDADDHDDEDDELSTSTNDFARRVGGFKGDSGFDEDPTAIDAVPALVTPSGDEDDPTDVVGGVASIRAARALGEHDEHDEHTDTNTEVNEHEEDDTDSHGGEAHDAFTFDQDVPTRQADLARVAADLERDNELVADAHGEATRASLREDIPLPAPRRRPVPTPAPHPAALAPPHASATFGGDLPEVVMPIPPELRPGSAGRGAAPVDLDQTFKTPALSDATLQAPSLSDPTLQAPAFDTADDFAGSGSHGGQSTMPTRGPAPLPRPGAGRILADDFGDTDDKLGSAGAEPTMRPGAAHLGMRPRRSSATRDAGAARPEVFENGTERGLAPPAGPDDIDITTNDRRPIKRVASRVPPSHSREARMQPERLGTEPPPVQAVTTAADALPARNVVYGAGASEPMAVAGGAQSSSAPEHLPPGDDPLIDDARPATTTLETLRPSGRALREALEGAPMHFEEDATTLQPRRSSEARAALADEDARAARASASSEQLAVSAAATASAAPVASDALTPASGPGPIVPMDPMIDDGAPTIDVADERALGELFGEPVSTPAPQQQAHHPAPLQHQPLRHPPLQQPPPQQQQPQQDAPPLDAPPLGQPPVGQPPSQSYAESPGRVEAPPSPPSQQASEPALGSEEVDHTYDSYDGEEPARRGAWRWIGLLLILLMFAAAGVGAFFLYRQRAERRRVKPRKRGALFVRCRSVLQIASQTTTSAPLGARGRVNNEPFRAHHAASRGQRGVAALARVQGHRQGSARVAGAVVPRRRHRQV